MGLNVYRVVFQIIPSSVDAALSDVVSLRAFSAADAEYQARLKYSHTSLASLRCTNILPEEEIRCTWCGLLAPEGLLLGEACTSCEHGHYKLGG